MYTPVIQWNSERKHTCISKLILTSLHTSICLLGFFSSNLFIIYTYLHIITREVYAFRKEIISEFCVDDGHVWWKMEVFLVWAEEALWIVSLVVSCRHLVNSELLYLHHVAALQQLSGPPLLQLRRPLTLTRRGCRGSGGRGFTLIDRYILCSFLDPCVTWGGGRGIYALFGLWSLLFEGWE